jgi:uncharacterized membrane protein (DUF2068 family)
MTPAGKAARDVAPRSGAFGLQLIVGYKLAKAVVELGFVVFFVVIGPEHLTEQARAAAVYFRHHAAAAWSSALAEWLIGAATERHVFVVALALLLDGVSSCVEGWALHRRYRWSRWLIVGATSCLLPFEGVALARHPSASRTALLLVNALIVIYLVRRGDAFARRAGY